MKKVNIIIIILFGIVQNVIAQKNTLYLFIEKPFFQYQTIKNIRIGFTAISKDKRFVCDYYQFGVFNLHWSEEKKDVINLPINNLREKVKIDTIPYETIKSLTHKKKWWKVHNQLSLYKKIFLVENIENKNGINTSQSNYYIIPLIYEGTRKNIIPTDLSINRK
ncbi:hypothetical protein [Tenacibaculum finnmarkense]|uniref:hypothetical protein n=1 Tax=Tenacibaculum finnmarkense TaxID=2781243 RepID=UPI001EFC101A|nr:hypothetical protein [Tenacibaculum finnmarkense]MCG8235126.1 hypothetical protein [Tenacibaculum finnmarkense genomovar ulcerans]MCG8829258.1 hypothetical protein [Tenacibaculum finnmarkense]